MKCREEQSDGFSKFLKGEKPPFWILSFKLKTRGGLQDYNYKSATITAKYIWFDSHSR